MAGRRPLPEERRRSEKVWTRITPAGKEAFLKACEKRGLTESDGVREALSKWTKEQRP